MWPPDVCQVTTGTNTSIFKYLWVTSHNYKVFTQLTQFYAPRIPCTPGSPVPQDPLYPRIPCTPESPVPLCLLICKTSLTASLTLGWLTLGSELTSSNYHRENYLAYFQKEEDLLLGTKEEIENLRPKTPPPKTRGTGRGRGMGRGGMGRGELFRH